MLGQRSIFCADSIIYFQIKTEKINKIGRTMSTTQSESEPVSDLLKSLFKVGDFVKVHDVFDAYVLEINDVNRQLLFKVKYILDNKVENNVKMDSLKVIHLQ